MTKKTLAPSRRRSTGPRSLEGKERSKLNAVKHGIFAAVILKNESPEEYQQLLTDLCRSLQPVGRLEHLLVEKLAATAWRYKRFLTAECAEIEQARIKVITLPGDEIRQASRSGWFEEVFGSIHQKIMSGRDSKLHLDVRELQELRHRIQEEGLDWDRDRSMLTSLFGKIPEETDSKKAPTQQGDGSHALTEGPLPLPVEYRKLAQTSGAENCGPRSRAAKRILERLSQKIENLEWLSDAAINRVIRLESEQMHAASIPQEKSSDRLLRYEAGLERVFDRTLSQLERLQRMRMGQPVLPPVKVELAG